MTGAEATLAVIDALEAAAAPYMLVGSLATNYYGVPRATQDADLVVELQAAEIAALAQRLGPDLRLDPQTSFETVTATVCHRLRVEGSLFLVELFLLSDDPHDRERFARRRRVAALGRSVYLPTVEDVIVTKLRWGMHAHRPKDIEDARNVIAVQHANVDWQYAVRWCDAHGTRGVLEQLRQAP
jgi:hypothetical protein